VEAPTDNPIDRTRHDWFRQKLDNTRIFDRMKVKTRDEKLKMPHFGFNERELTELVTFLSGLVKEPIPLQMTQRLEGEKGLVEAGARVIRNYNCKGCHQFDLDEMRILAEVTDKFGKPRLDPVWVHGLGTWVPDEDTGEDAMSFVLWKGAPKLEKGPSDPVYVAKGEVQIFEPADRGTIVPLLVKKYEDEKGMGPEARTYAPPVLVGEGKKVRSRWLFDFLRQPVTLRPWLEVRMPTFPFDDSEINDLTAYFAARDGEPFPFESIREQDAAYLESMEKKHGNYFTTAEALFNNKDVNCVSCHVRGSVTPEGDPSGWAPDLSRAKERLSPRWVRAWLASPQELQPGTKMPKFPWGDTYPDAFSGDAASQIEAIKDYLMNMPEPDGTRALPD
jgi:mono/diheme cytochrome c family protein